MCPSFQNCGDVVRETETSTMDKGHRDKAKDICKVQSVWKFNNKTWSVDKMVAPN